jgi:hypothetical protein
MAVTLRGVAHNSVNSTPITITKPTGTVDGDVMIAIVSVSGAAHTPSTPSGWTVLDTETTGPSVQTYWKIASSEGANYSFTFTSGQSASGIIISYSGADGTTPIHKHSAINRATSTTTVTALSVTPTVDNCMLLFVGGVNATAATFSSLGSYTQQDHFGTFSVTVFVADLFQASHAASGNATATASASGTTDGSLIAIQPPAAAAPVNTVAPAVTGTPTEGSVLSCTTGTWTG